MKLTLSLLLMAFLFVPQAVWAEDYYPQTLEECYASRVDNRLCDAIHIDVREGTEALMAYIEKHPELKDAHVNKYTLLFDEDILKNSAYVKRMLEIGYSPNAALETGWTVLHQAVGDFEMRGNEEVIRLLVNAGADVNAVARMVDSDSKTVHTPLSVAVGYGYTNIVRFLLESGAKMNTANKSGKYLLSFAANYGRASTVKLLLDKGVDPFEQEEGEIPLEIAKKSFERLKEYAGGNVDPQRKKDFLETIRFLEEAMSKKQGSDEL